jgi:hypothetical protein
MYGKLQKRLEAVTAAPLEADVDEAIATCGGGARFCALC